MTDLVTVDVGGTHARFAIASIDRDGGVLLRYVTKLRSDDFATFEAAWANFEQKVARPLPLSAAVAAAGPVRAGRVVMTNHPWILDRADLTASLGLERLHIINDLAAIAHSVDRIPDDTLHHLGGPAGSLQNHQAISVIGLGTGLGTALLLRQAGARSVVQPGEGGHAGFAPSNDFEMKLWQSLRNQTGFVSVEQIASGQGVVAVHEALGGDPSLGDKEVWRAALEGSDRRAVDAAVLLCLAFGSAAGDIALVNGASAVVLAGGLVMRAQTLLASSGFMDRFVAKGRFADDLAKVPVKLLAFDDAGLIGAAEAFVRHEGA